MLASTERHPFFYGLLIVATGACAAVFLVFWEAIFWAVVIGGLFRPVELKLSQRFHQRQTLAALLTVVLIFFTVLLPAMLVASMVASEAAGFYTSVQSGELDFSAISQWFKQSLPHVVEWLSGLGVDISELSEKLSSLAVAISQMIGSLTLRFGQNLLSFIVMFFLMLYLLFFILRDGGTMIEQLHRAIPLPYALEKRLFGKFSEVSRATVKGSLIIGLSQGILGGLIFAMLGIDGAVFWGVVMVVLSVVPAVGAGLVWAPAALLLVLAGSWGKAVVLVAFGVLVIGLLDNFLRPILVGRDTKMPDYVILISTLGGLSLFGFTGIVLGPVIAALFIAVWQIYREEPEEEFGLASDATSE
jgi:predicted PurR-regulated permease PerM